MVVVVSHLVINPSKLANCYQGSHQVRAVQWPLSPRILNAATAAEDGRPSTRHRLGKKGNNMNAWRWPRGKETQADTAGAVVDKSLAAARWTTRCLSASIYVYGVPRNMSQTSWKKKGFPTISSSFLDPTTISSGRRTPLARNCNGFEVKRWRWFGTWTEFIHMFPQHIFDTLSDRFKSPYLK